MDEKQREWSSQYSSNIGTGEFFRLGFAILLWIFTGIGLSLAIGLEGFSGGFVVFAIFLIILFVFAFITALWEPTYSLLRKLLANENLPREPFPRSTTKTSRKPRQWWSYLPGFWFSLLAFLLLYLVIKYFSK